MAVARRATFGFLALAWLATHSGPAAAAEAELPWKDLAADLKGHTIVANIDEDSFDAATAHYPRPGGGTVPIEVGRYLMWRIVGLFTSDQRVDQMRLLSFVMSCRTTPAMAAVEVVCDLNATVLVRKGGTTRIIDISNNSNVGRLFDPANADYATVVYAELRDPLDKSVAKVKADLMDAGVL